ncbi:hypothetical protein P171DRAFT_496605 [Karstenula rhodostoma CBS 690.94]|uniref:Zn(2)-C6 fungal-type domain-containing protein n=1 Tax=Karstenula rhodostoma CBS 690.94 TaxID=1392251 RepID=A0A9P4U9B0_9PLEO|nr:hypothetical protein P171DRAFT_496605 [Karstenula rhodostoma CBS 690.94]
MCKSVRRESTTISYSWSNTDSLCVLARSIHGCWTCRLRKKKCDESRPLCFKCSLLQIDCHGYGPRPYWMDRGALQREQALKLKHLISQIKFNMRQQKESGTVEHVEARLNDLITGHRTLTRRLISEPAKKTPSKSALAFINDHTSVGTGVDLSTSTRSIHSEPSDYVTFTSEPCFKRTLGATMCGCSQCSSGTSPNSSNSDFFLEQEEITREYVDLLMQSGQSKFSKETMVSLHEPVLISNHYNTENEQSNGRNARCASPQNSFPGFECQMTQPVGRPNLNPAADTDDDLLMHYFDRVFYLCCPFYPSTSSHGRGWLFSILMRKSSVYHAALALSEYHQATSSQQTSFQLMQGRGKHYNLALQELQACIGNLCSGYENLCLEHNIEVLAAILHLLFYEMMNGGKRNWQMHLRASNAFIPALVQAQMASSQAGLQYANGLQDTMSSKTVPRPAISFILGFLVYIDIISCISTRSRPILTLDHKLILTTGGIELPILIGCDNWAMVFMFEILCLDKWQEEENKARKMSLMELTNRGREIEGRLKARLADYRDGLSSYSRMRGDVDNIRVTRVLALSAMTYLHVVISGAYPEIPEIRDSVSKTIDALKSLPDPKLLRHVTWSLCISGCLAVDGQQQNFRDLASSPHISQSSLEAFKIVEECWHLRETSRCDCDWARVMKQMGEHILLG